MTYLLDTNVCIDFSQGRSIRVLEHMQGVGSGALAMSAITYAELAVGARLSGDADVERLEALTRFVAVLAFDEGAALAYGRMIRAMGVRRNHFDHLIAAHALSRGLTVVTNNARDFTDIPDLKVENWTL